MTSPPTYKRLLQAATPQLESRLQKLLDQEGGSKQGSRHRKHLIRLLRVQLRARPDAQAS